MKAELDKINIHDFFKQNENFILFVFFFVFYMTIGSCIFWYKPINENMFFGADNARAFGDLISIGGNHYRIKVHPLFLIFCQPLCLLVNGFAQNPKIAVLIVEAGLASGCVATTKSILEKLLNSNLIKWLFVILYGFSFSCMIFGTIPETFIFAGFALASFWNYCLCIENGKKEFSKKETAVLVFFCLLCFGMTITNIVFYMIGLLYVCLKRKKTFLEGIKTFFTVSVLNAISTIAFVVAQKLIWRDSPIFLRSLYDAFFDKSNFEEYRYMNFNFSFSKLYAFFKQFFLFPLVSADMAQTTVNEYYHPILFTGLNPFVFGVAFFIVLLAAFVVLKMTVKNIASKNRTDIYNFMLAAYIGNFLLHFIYGSNEAFMYSPHYLFLFVILFAGGLDKSKGIFKKISISMISLFVLVEIANNIIRFLQMTGIVLKFHGSSYSRFKSGIKGFILSLAFLLATWVVVKIFNKCKNSLEKTPYFLPVEIYLFVIAIMSVAIRLA